MLQGVSLRTGRAPTDEEREILFRMVDAKIGALNNNAAAEDSSAAHVDIGEIGVLHDYDAANAVEEVNPAAEVAEAEEKRREIERSAAFAKESTTLPERASAAPAAVALSSSISEEHPGSAKESLDAMSATAAATPADGGGDVGVQPEHDDALRSQLRIKVPR